MMARSFGSLCLLLLTWFCALGAGPVRHPAILPVETRSAVELALRDVAQLPLLAARSVEARFSSSRLGERSAPPTPLATSAARSLPLAQVVIRGTRTTLALQRSAHAARPRWRPYDAAAPPALSRTAR